MKKMLVLFVLTALVTGGCARNEKEAAEAAGVLVVWSFTDEIKTIIDTYYAPAHPRITVEYSLKTSDIFQGALDPALASGKAVPDVFALEDPYLRKYIESGMLLDISDIAKEVKDSQFSYPLDTGTFGGKTYGLSWKVTPGALFYRRSYAKKYLGTDDPAEVQKLVSDPAKFLATAALLKEKSGGKCVIVPSSGELFLPCKAARAQPWIVNGKLVIDPAMIAYMEMAKTFREDGYEAPSAAQWSMGWFNGMKGKQAGKRDAEIEVFSYFLPTWGLQYVLKTNASETGGDWAMVAGPVPYRWGGTWIAAYKDTKNPVAVKDFIRFAVSERAFQEAWALETGDIVTDTVVSAKIAGLRSEPFLGGQNHYAQFVEIAKKVNGKLSQNTDASIDALFAEAVNSYITGAKTREKALGDFRIRVAAQLGL